MEQDKRPRYKGICPECGHELWICKSIFMEMGINQGAGSPSLRVAYAKKKRRIRRRRLRAARRAAVIFAAILIVAAIICKIMAAEEPVEVPVEEIQQETEAGELPHKATGPERAQQEPIQETRSGSGNSRNEYLLARLAMAEAEGECIEGKAMVIRVVLNNTFSH